MPELTSHGSARSPTGDLNYLVTEHCRAFGNWFRDRADELHHPRAPENRRVHSRGEPGDRSLMTPYDSLIAPREPGRMPHADQIANIEVSHLEKSEEAVRKGWQE
jgi:hypothetical protein